MPAPCVDRVISGVEFHTGGGGGGGGGGGSGGGGGGQGPRWRRNTKGGGDNQATRTANEQDMRSNPSLQEHNSYSRRTTVDGEGGGSGSGGGDLASSIFGGSTRGGCGRNDGEGCSQGGPHRQHWGGDHGNGGEGVNSGAGQDPADRQPIQEFQQWVSEPGAPAVEAQENFEADGFMPRYVGQVRHFLRERDRRAPSPRVTRSATASTEGESSAREGTGYDDGFSTHALSGGTQGVYGGGDDRRDFVGNGREPPPEQFEMNQEKIYSGHSHYDQYQHHRQQTYPHVSSSVALQQGATFMDQPLSHPEHYSQTSVPTIPSSGGSGSDCSTSVGVQAAADNRSWRALADAPFTSLHSSAAGPLTDVDGESLDAAQRFSPECGAGRQNPAAWGVSSQADDPFASSSRGYAAAQGTPKEEQWTRYLDPATNVYYWNDGNESTWEDPYPKESNLQRQQHQQQDQGAWGSVNHQPSLSQTLDFQGPSAYYPGDEMSGVRLAGEGPAGSSLYMPHAAARLYHDEVGDSPAQDGARNGGDLGSGDVIVGGRGQSMLGSGTSNLQLGWDQQPREVVMSVQASSRPASVQHGWGISGDIEEVVKVASESGWDINRSVPPRRHSHESRVAMAPGAGLSAYESAPQSAWGCGNTNQASQSGQQIRALGPLYDDKGIGESSWGSPHQNHKRSWDSPHRNRKSTWGSPHQNHESCWDSPEQNLESSWSSPEEDPQQQEQGWPQQGQHPHVTLDPAQVANRSNLQVGLDAAPSSHLSREQQHHKRAAVEGSSSFAGGGHGTPAAAPHAQQNQMVAEHLHRNQQQHQGQRRRKQEIGPSAPMTNLGITRIICGEGGKDPRAGAHGRGIRGGVQQQQRGGMAEAASVPEASRDGWGTNGPGETPLPASSVSPAPAWEAQGTEDKEKNRHGRLPPKRSVRNQVGLVYLTHPNETGIGGTAVSARGYGPLRVHPSAHLRVRWELPAGAVDGVGRCHRSGDERQRLVVGIFRLGVLSNTGGIISKKLFERPTRSCHDPRQLLFGNVAFYAPKSVGTFVFRIYDASDPIDTLATSHAWQVDVQGKDVELNVRFVLNQLRNADGKGSVMGALAQLTHLLGHVQTAPLQRYNPSIGNALWDALTAARNQLDSVKIGSFSGSPEKNGDGADSDRRLRGLHGAVWCVLDAIICNPAAAVLLADAPPQLHPTDPLGSSISCVMLCSLWQNTFCPFEERYYDSPQALAEHYKEDFAFTPSSLPLERIDPTVLYSLTEQMNALLPRILPSVDFSEERERVRARLEHVLLMQLPETMFPRGSALRVFGSTSNGFGNASADLDMCIEYAGGVSHPEDAGALIESIAENLQAAGLLEVDSRPTARVPIVMFRDGESGLQCDISVMNPLALRNTRLLKAYSEADLRVKSLGYVVKHWAKQRLVNNASEGTLSSYGYLLCLVHFLQTRNPPVVPNLQALPPDWDGQTCPGFSNREIPVVITTQPFDGMECNTYFYDPMAPGREGEARRAILREFGSRNRSSSGELLAGFFRYFASELDCRSNVVSVRLGGLAGREWKAEACCWSMHTRLSIEDPFETWYDVGHVLKWSRFKQVRLEFARAYVLLARPGLVEGRQGDILNLLETICSEAETRPSTRLDERASDERAEEMAEQLKLLDLDAHAL